MWARYFIPDMLVHLTQVLIRSNKREPHHNNALLLVSHGWCQLSQLFGLVERCGIIYYFYLSFPCLQRGVIQGLLWDVQLKWFANHPSPNHDSFSVQNLVWKWVMFLNLYKMCCKIGLLSSTWPKNSKFAWKLKNFENWCEINGNFALNLWPWFQNGSSFSVKIRINMANTSIPQRYVPTQIKDYLPPSLGYLHSSVDACSAQYKQLKKQLLFWLLAIKILQNTTEANHQAIARLKKKKNNTTEASFVHQCMHTSRSFITQ